jgi:4-amino-4-deoxy-L-arabinose transferase-like glycosyltransferase
MEGDESGYIYFANNLLQGFYSPPAPDINLWWGPGYPILLMPFVALGLPLICITLMNAIFQYLSIVLLFKAMLDFVDYRKALLFTLLWAFCYSSYQYLYVIYTEAFTISLISLLIFSIVKAFNTHLKKYLIFSGLILGYIALTKVMFGYVILFLLLGSVVLWITNRRIINYKKSVLIMLIAFITVMPYLIYTYNLTGRLFYWGNSGGISLYWMSTPYENEYGNWVNETFTVKGFDRDKEGTTNEFLKLNHQKDIDEVMKYKGVYKDDAYKRIAVNNIKTHPGKYIKNIITNISDILFGFPISYTYQIPLMKVWYFSILYSLMVFCSIPTIINWRNISFSIRFLLVLCFIYLAGTSLVSGGNRQFVIIVPLLLIWIVYIIDQSITFKINFRKGD